MPALALPTAQITIVGLGPGDVDGITLGVWAALHSGRRVILRTERHPCVAVLAQGIPLTTCDDLYEAHDDFAEIYAAISQRVMAAAQDGPVIYAVPGHPWVGEQTTGLIQRAAAQAGLSVAVLGGGSFVEASFAALGLDPMEGSQCVDGMILAHRHHPNLDLHQPALIGQIYARHVASDVKLTLLNAYPPQHEVTLVQAADTPNQRLIPLPLAELDHRDDFDHLTSLYVPPIPRSSLADLMELVAHLRAPEGCPWDQEQTLESMRPFLLDEAAEAIEAIDNEDDFHTAEELGDVLGIVCMMAQIAAEEGRFQIGDAIRASVEKLTRRHPHVFGDDEVESMDALYVQWDAIKAQERAANGKPPKSPLDLPASLPALEKVRQMQSKAEKMGLLRRADLAQADPRLGDLLPPGSGEAELGLLLWRLTALAHQRELSPEEALRSFAVRFREASRS